MAKKPKGTKMPKAPKTTAADLDDDFLEEENAEDAESSDDTDESELDSEDEPEEEEDEIVAAPPAKKNKKAKEAFLEDEEDAPLTQAQLEKAKLQLGLTKPPVGKKSYPQKRLMVSLPHNPTLEVFVDMIPGDNGLAMRDNAVRKYNEYMHIISTVHTHSVSDPDAKVKE